MRIPPIARALLLAGWMGLIFAMSAQTDSGEDSSWLLQWLLRPFGAIQPEALVRLNLIFRKVAHFTEYAILALLWTWNLGVSPARLLLAWAASTVYAASDEWHQAFVPGRGPSPWDVAIDSAGAFASITTVRIRVMIGRANPRRGA